VEKAHGDLDAHRRIEEHLGMKGAAVRMDSQAKYGVLAQGDAEIYLRMPTRPGYREWIWDQAAGSLVIEEAGGRVSDAFGEPLDFTTGRRLQRNRGIVATNGALHPRLIDAIQRVARPAPE
jgi:3'(2'), 5'-bisphosphate nucleotidase